MNIAFWSEEAGSGMTSSMAAVASICSDVWNIKTVLLQSRNQKGDLYQKLGAGSFGWHDRITADRLVTVRKGRLYYLMQPDYAKQQQYPEFFKKSMQRLIQRAEQFAELAFTDCGSGEDALSADILSRADVSVINISQGRRHLEQFFQKRHACSGRAVYLVNQYHQESVYNKQYLNRQYRIPKEALAVIPGSQFFRYASDNGKAERFVLKYARCMKMDGQSYFMQELVHAADLILNSAGFEKGSDQWTKRGPEACRM